MKMKKHEYDNNSLQLNPCNWRFWASRGYAKDDSELIASAHARLWNK